MKKDKLRKLSVEAGHKKRPLLAVIRADCLKCCPDGPSDVRKCEVTDCDLWPYRFGTNPFRTTKLSEAVRSERVQRLPWNSDQKNNQQLI